MLLLPLLTGCVPFGTAELPTPTPDPCSGWWCTVKGVVTTGEGGSGNRLAGATVTLSQHSNCSPTRGDSQTVSGSDGSFEFGQLFFHDTDLVWIEVEAEGFEPARWDSKGQYCYYCACFSEAIEVALQVRPSP
jgi:hypothetical protein